MRDYIDMISPPEYSHAEQRTYKYAVMITAIHITLRWTLAKPFLMLKIDEPQALPQAQP